MRTMDPLRHLPGIKDRLQVGRRLVGRMPCTTQTDSQRACDSMGLAVGGSSVTARFEGVTSVKLV